MYRYIGSFGTIVEGLPDQFLQGIPCRDLTEAEWVALSASEKIKAYALDNLFVRVNHVQSDNPQPELVEGEE